MKQHPKIKFKADLRTDTENCVSFLKHKRPRQNKQFVVWFLPEEFRYILDKKISIKKRDEIIKEYVKHVYKIKSKEIKEETKKAISEWRKVEIKYFKLVSKIFKNHPWPKGNYRGFASIFHMFPRYIDRKIFFFPYTHKIPKFANKVIAHEMLHFIFFDYINKKYGLRQDSKIKGQPNNYIWQVSEVFNNAMESWDPYKKIFKFGSRPYSGTEKIFAQMKKRWAKKQDVDWLLDKWLKNKNMENKIIDKKSTDFLNQAVSVKIGRPS